MTPIAGSAVRRTLASPQEPSTSKESSPGRSNAPRTSKKKPISRVRPVERDSSESEPKRRKIRLSEFPLRQKPLVIDSDSDDSIGPSVSQRGSPTQRRRPENRQALRPVQQVAPSLNRAEVAVNDPDAPRQPRKKNPWTPEEAELVRRGFMRYGTTCRLIRQRYFPEDSPRSIENIRDKIKTMQKRGELPRS